MESHTPRRGCWACYGQSSGQFLLSFLFLPFQKMVFGQKRWTAGWNVKKLKRHDDKLSHLQKSSKDLTDPVAKISGSAVFLNPILHWCEESFLNEFWKRSCLSSSSYVGVAKVLMNSERRLYKTSLSYFLRLFSTFYQKQLKTSV